MAGHVVRWILIALMILSLCVLVSSPVLAEVTELAPDQTVPGCPTIRENWKSIPAAEAPTNADVVSHGTVQPNVLVYDPDNRTWTPSDTPAKTAEHDWQTYTDDSISIRTEYASLKPASKKQVVPAAIVFVKIANPTQIRTAMSYDDYNKRAYTSAEKMSEHVNAAAAINGDFFKYFYNVGYVLRQGRFYRNSLDGKRDVLVIDSSGDFHGVPGAQGSDVDDCIAALPEGVTAMNTFSLGPILVEDGVARDMQETCTAAAGQLQWKYAQQRAAVVQLGELEYALVETYGKTDSSCGLTLQELADFIAFYFPGCKLAYNMDGGGSTNVMVDSKRIHTTPGHREISDILYFASADDRGVAADAA